MLLLSCIFSILGWSGVVGWIAFAGHLSSRKTFEVKLFYRLLLSIASSSFPWKSVEAQSSIQG